MTTSGTDTSRMMTDAVDSFSRFLNKKPRVSAPTCSTPTPGFCRTLSPAPVRVK